MKYAPVKLVVLTLVMALVLTLVVSATLPASAATAGPSNAGTGTNVNGPGTIAWSNPGNITPPAGAPYATAVLTTTATSEYLQGTNYGFAIPAGQVIAGIQVSIRRMSSANTGGNSINDVDLYLLKAGAIVGTNHAVATDWPIAMGVANYGATNDLWGTTWTPADINDANFGVSLSVYNQSGFGNRTASVDYMQITVTYGPPHTITASAGAGGTISPSGAVVVAEGSSQTFTITPNSTYIVSDVLVDSVSVGRVNSYTFTNVTTDHTISATFDGGWTAPTLNRNVASVTNPGNAYTSNDAYAVFNANGDSVDYYTFGLSIPGGATIDGIEVAAEGRRDNDRTVDVSLSSDGTAFTAVKNLATYTTSDSTLVAGGATDNWGRAWSVADLTGANFTVRVRVPVAAFGNLNLDQLQVKVYYTTIIPTTLAVDPVTGTYGGTENLTATLSPAVAGKTINFYINGESKGNASTDAFGVATLNGVALTVGGVPLNVGTYTGTYNTSGVGANFAGDATYAASTDAADLTVGKATLTVTADNKSITYGDAEPAYTGQYSGFVGSDNASVLDTPPTGAVSGPHSNAGSYSIVFSGGVDNNYNFNYVNGTLTVGKADATINVFGWTGTYDGIAHGATGSATGVLSENLTTMLNFGSSFTNVPGGTATWTFTDTTGNYNDDTGTVDITISKADLTITAVTNTKTYDGDTSAAATPSVSGLLGSNTVTGLTEVYDNANVGSGKTLSVATYAVNDGNGGNNYNVILVDVYTGVIDQASLTITANDRSKTYGDTVTFAGTEFTVTGLVNADSVTSVTLTSAGAAAGATVAGSPYSIVPSAATGTGLGNYTITYVGGGLTVTPATLTITAASVSKTYGDTLTFAGTELTVAGLVNADTITSVTLTSAGMTAAAAAGTHEIVPSAAAGTGLENYDITYVSSTLTVNPKALSIAASDRTKTYGTAVTFAGTEFTVAGLVNADTVTSVTLTSDGAAASAAAVGSPYSIVPSAAAGTGLGNYAISYVNGALTVNKSGTGCSITSSLATSKRGKPVTFTVTVTGVGATGTVTFQDGGTVLGSGTLNDGTATYSTSGLAAGSHFITAAYSGDANFAGSTSTPITHAVKKPAGVNWGLIIGLILAGILVSLFFFLIFFARRRKKDEQEQKT